MVRTGDGGVGYHVEQMSNAPRLLVLACSRRKRDTADPLLALERYDGGLFRIVRRFLRSSEATLLDILIVSAEYGLLDATTPIPRYERRMTAARAQALATEVQGQLRDRLAERTYQAALMCLPMVYRSALGRVADLAPPTLAITVTTCPRAEMAARLHDWLYGHPPASTRTPSDSPVLRGRTIHMSRSEEHVQNSIYRPLIEHALRLRAALLPGSVNRVVA